MKRKTACTCLAVTLAAALLTSACQRKDVPASNAWALLPFSKVDSVNPVLTPGENTFTCPILNRVVEWDKKDVFNPAAVIRHGEVHLIFRAEDTVGRFAGTSRLGLAVSKDGLRFSKRPEPIFYPADDSMKVYEWEGGVEDPRIVESPDGRYVMTYTAYDGKTARLFVASSSDLVSWTKHGPVLRNKYIDVWSKSGAIVAARKGEQVIAQKINGTFWMYFGDTNLYIATSDDLISWQPVEQGDSLKPVLRPRPGYFDSRLVESGPYALITDEGILLLYNGMNLDEGGDPSLSSGAYASGQALFSKEDPTQLKDRLENFFMKPDKPYEVDGQVNHVCFIEGMVPFRGKWFLYYGTADSRIAVAVHEMN